MIKRLFLCLCMLFVPVAGQAGDAVEITGELIEVSEQRDYFADGEIWQINYTFQIFAPSPYAGERFSFNCNALSETGCPLPNGADQGHVHDFFRFNVSDLIKYPELDINGYLGNVDFKSFKRIEAESRVSQTYYAFLTKLLSGDIEGAYAYCDRAKVKIVAEDALQDTVPYLNVKFIQKQNGYQAGLFNRIVTLTLKDNKTALVRTTTGYYHLEKLQNNEWKITGAGLKPIM